MLGRGDDQPFDPVCCEPDAKKKRVIVLMACPAVRFVTNAHRSHDD
jgi:hypothetical protein